MRMAIASDIPLIYASNGPRHSEVNYRDTIPASCVLDYGSAQHSGGSRLSRHVSGTRALKADRSFPRKWLIRNSYASNNKVPGSARMTTESTQPQPEVGPSPANGPGQSQGHRRRRRRRKNKSSRQGAPQAQVAQLQQPAQQAQPTAQAPQAPAPPPKPTGTPAPESGPEEEEVLPEGLSAAAAGQQCLRHVPGKAQEQAARSRASLSGRWITATGR